MRPGQMCRYRHGKITSLVLEQMKNSNNNEDPEAETLDHYDAEDQDSEKMAAIEVHGRDFLASLSRVI